MVLCKSRACDFFNRSFHLFLSRLINVKYVRSFAVAFLVRFRVHLRKVKRPLAINIWPGCHSSYQRAGEPCFLPLKMEKKELLRTGNVFYYFFPGMRKNTFPFTFAGESYKLDLSGPLFSGGLSDHLDPLRAPPAVLWTASLKKGFVGCLSDVVNNGLSVDVAHFASKQDSGKTKSVANFQKLQNKAHSALETRPNVKATCKKFEPCGS